IKAPPRFAKLLAAVDRSGLTHRGRAERRIQSAEIIGSYLDITPIGEGRETPDLQLTPTLPPVGATKQPHPVRQEHRSWRCGADGHGMSVHHALNFGVAP